MTLKEFREATKDFPETMNIMVNNRDLDAEFQYELIQEVSVKQVLFKDGKLKATESCIVIETI